MRASDRYQFGVAQRQVAHLQPGDRVDLEGDVVADPGWANGGQSEHPEFEFEFEVVLASEREGKDCTRVDFESGFSCGFPPDHWLDVDAEQEI